MSAGDAEFWENIGHRPKPNWYLDPLAAEWKKRDHRKLLSRWMAASQPARILKTDLFEEAFGEDALLFDLVHNGAVYGMDLSISTVRSARDKAPYSGGCFAVGDLRMLPFRSESFECILSTSSLDHFDTEQEFAASLEQLIRALRPGGRLILTLDNVWNPLYFPLKWLSRFAWSPFPLGYAPGPSALKGYAKKNGLRLIGGDCLVHNPRMISTALFLVLRRTLGRNADFLISGLLRIFSCLDRLPTRYFSACFVALIADKPESKFPACGG